MYCRKCGNQLREEDVFCCVCGTKKTECDNEDACSEQGSNFNLGKFLAVNKIPILCMVCVLIVCSVFFGIKRHKQAEYDEAWKKYKMAEEGFSSGTKASSRHKYENSTYKVGSDMPAGEYVLFASNNAGYFCLSSDSAGDSIICNANFKYNSIITVRNGEYLKLNRCYAEKISDVSSVSTSGEGMFKIGTFLKAGEYQLEATDDTGYYCVYGDDRQDDIVYNDNFEGKAYVTVRNGEYLKLSRCKIIK